MEKEKKILKLYICFKMGIEKITTTFKGPYHKNFLLNKNEGEEENISPGIYIWGFLYKKDIENNHEPEPLNISEKEYETLKSIDVIDLKDEFEFIPIYVGKSESNVKKRITDHFNENKKEFNKYTRFALDYYKLLGYDSSYPENIGGQHYKRIYKLMKKDEPVNKKVLYFNHKYILEFLKINVPDFSKFVINDDPSKITDQPLTDTIKQYDTLKKIICERDNFYFFYASIENEDYKLLEGSFPKGKTLEVLESLTFHSLKRKTIGKTLSSKSLEKRNEILNKHPKNIQLVINSNNPEVFNRLLDKKKILI